MIETQSEFLSKTLATIMIVTRDRLNFVINDGRKQLSPIRSPLLVLPTATSWPLVTVLGTILSLSVIALIGISILWRRQVRELKQTQQALQHSQQTLKDLTNSIPGAVYQYKVDHNHQHDFIFISEGIRDLFQVSPEQAMANPKMLWDMLSPATRSRIQQSLEESAATLSPWEIEFELNLPNDQTKWIKEKAIPKTVDDGVIWNGFKVDITQEKWQEQLLATQQEILEDLAEGKTLDTIITQLIQLIEQQTEGVIGSVLLREGNHLWPCGQSRLPREYLAYTMKGIPIREGFGSCGTAAYRGKTVITTDIEIDPLWETIRELPLKYQLRACWSTPILSSTHQVLGTFAMYTDVPRNPYPHEQDLVNIATKLTGLAMERKQQEQALQQQAEQEKVLTQVTQQIRQSLELQTVLDTTVQQVHNLLNSDRVLIYALYRNSGKVIAETVNPQWRSLMGQTIDDPCLTSNPSNGSSGELTPDIQKIADIEQANLDPCYRQMLRNNQVRANLVIPIWQTDRRWGFLIAQQCSQPRQWEPKEIQILEKLSEHLGIAIQQAELYEQAQTQLQQREQLANQLRFQAFHDSLTELPNRTLLMDRLSNLFQRYRNGYEKDSSCFALLFLDLNDFKTINDTLGHEAGDELLITVAQRLKGSLREQDTVGRLGGDEFIVLLEGISTERNAIEIAERIYHTLTPPTSLYGQQINIHTSIGIVMNRPDYVNPEQMLRDADIAMYQAKANKLKYVMFHPDMELKIVG